MSRHAVHLWLTRLFALLGKESKQIVRDPSSWLVGFALPAIFLLFFGFALSFDVNGLKLGVINESQGKPSHDLVLSFQQSPHFTVATADSRQQASEWMISSTVQAVLIIPNNFDALFLAGSQAPVQLLVDGVDPNTATFFNAYSQGVIMSWQKASGLIRTVPQFWYNNTVKSRWALIPGAITIVMTLIGTLLTSLVITREWERGTMEALFASPVSRMQILLSKLIPYYVMSMISMSLCALAGVFLFGVPMRGSILALVALSSAFMMPSLGQGLLISSLFRSQLPAAIIGFMTGLLPSFILSGLLFDINSMPFAIQCVTYLVPARYFNVAMQTLFLAGDIWPVFGVAIVYMLVLGGIFLVLTYHNITKKLD